LGPDVIHANDWHAAAAVSWIHHHRAQDPFWRGTATVFTIHNLAYAGAGAEEAWQAYGLPPAAGAGVADWARPLPLVGALTTADWLTTVSPTYAKQIALRDYGFGLDPILAARRAPPDRYLEWDRPKSMESSDRSSDQSEIQRRLARGTSPQQAGVVGRAWF
jgi:glycogen synthase